MTEHRCIKEPQLMRLDRDAAAAEADRRELRADVMDAMGKIHQEIVGMSKTTAEHVGEVKEDLAELKDALDRRTAALFARMDDLSALLGAKGHA